MTLGLKKTALRIHSLSEKDRKWILNALPNSQRESVEEMLAQLERLSVPKNEAWLDFEPNTQGVVEKTNLTDGDLLLMVDLFNVSQVRVVLDEMPESLVLAVLAMHDWHWREQYLSKLKMRFRSHYENGIKRLKGKISPKVRFHLLKDLVDRVESNLINSAYKPSRSNLWAGSRQDFVMKWSR